MQIYVMFDDVAATQKSKTKDNRKMTTVATEREHNP
jgi:hypothetical protein